MDDIRELKEKLWSFESLPYLFIGSGFSRRYLQTEDWKQLLMYFASKIDPHNPLAYETIANRVNRNPNDSKDFPVIGSALENEFNRAWYSGEGEWLARRTLYAETIRLKGVSPFKFELANHFMNKELDETASIKSEIDLIRGIATKNIAGIITTNYDCLLENLFESFEVYIGQNQLLFSNSQGIGEIYKIHGCCSDPNSLVINEADYISFGDRQAYLAAKLLTIFIEHPIVFIGYSLGDANIRSILASILKCLDDNQKEKLKDRFFFVEYDANPQATLSLSEAQILLSESSYSIKMMKIQAHDYSPIYEALQCTKSKYPVKVLRRIKENVYDLVTTNNPTDKIRVTNIDDSTNADDIEFVLGVGVLSDVGYKSIEANDIYEDIIFDDRNYNCERIVIDTLPALMPRNKHKLPMFKYLSKVDDSIIPIMIWDKKIKSLQEILSNSLNKRKNKPCYLEYNKMTIRDLRAKHSDCMDCLNRIWLTDMNHHSADDLMELIIDIFAKNREIFTCKKYASDMKRLIRVYDWLVYGNTKSKHTYDERSSQN